MPSLSFLSYFNCCNQFLDSLLPLYCVAKQTWWILVKSNFPPTLSCIFFKFNILCWFLLFLPSSWWWVAHSIYVALPISMYFCCCYLFHAILPLNIILFISSHIAFKYILVHISIWDLFPDLHSPSLLGYCAGYSPKDSQHKTCYLKLYSLILVMRL